MNRCFHSNTHRCFGNRIGNSKLPGWRGEGCGLAVREGFLEKDASEITWDRVGACQRDLWEGTIGIEGPSTDQQSPEKTRRQGSDLIEESGWEGQVWPMVRDAGRAAVSLGQRCGCGVWQEEGPDAVSEVEAVEACRPRQASREGVETVGGQRLTPRLLLFAVYPASSRGGRTQAALSGPLQRLRVCVMS